MKQIKINALLFLMFITTMLFSCSDNKENIGITEQSWTDDVPTEISSGSITQVTFNATDNWTASTSSDWCEIINPSGSKGDAVLKITAFSSTQSKRNAVIEIKINDDTYAKISVVQKPTAIIASDDVQVNNIVDEYLEKYYLWNDEYKTLTLDFNKDYAEFFDDALLSMTTNTLDKRLYEGGNYYLFSYIEKISSVSKSRSTKYVDKELQYSFGITGLLPIILSTENGNIMYFVVQGIYPDSPAASAGLKRGSIISRINNVALSISDYYLLTSPSSSRNITVTEVYGNTKEISLLSKAMYCNPIIMSKVETIGSHKIGYLVYSSFDAAFDMELFNVFKDFKSQNVTDLILDLRYNGGGHTISANMIASCIVGNDSKGKVFASYRYNTERMKVLNNKRDEDKFAINSYGNLGTSLTEGALGLKKVYCIVGEETASASELVINALKGIDVDVVLIGEKTVGKNVGMEYKDFTVNNSTYRVVPITFQSYNAKGYGDYEAGFTPAQDFLIDETNPDNEDNLFIDYEDYGNSNEPLYAKAIETITGQKIATSRSNSYSTYKGKPIKIKPKYRLGFNGMLKKAE